MILDRAYNFIEDAREYLYQTKERANLAARDRRMAALLDIDEPTTADVLRADFGTDNIKGLDIITFPEYETSFFNISEYEHYEDEQHRQELITTSAAFESRGDIYIQDDDLRSLRYNPNGYNDFSNTISHENIHVIQRKDMAWMSDNPHNNTNMQQLHNDGFNRGPVGRLTDKFNRAAVDAQAYAAHKLRVSDYFSEEVEIQARLHEIMANGYAAWGRMPANKTEFYAALKNIGVNMPPHIKHDLHATEEGRQALKDFRCSKVLRENMESPAKDLNFVHEYAANNTTQKFLWDKAYPAIYGQLLEYYGDSLGRERLGLGPNQQPAVKFLKAFDYENDDDFKAHIDHMAPTLRPELAQNLLERILGTRIAGTRQENLSAKRKSDIEKLDYAFHALCREPEIARTMKADIYEVHASRIPTQSPGPLLMYALESGNKEAIDMCLQAGCDPHTKILYVDDIHGHPPPPPRSILENFQHSFSYAQEQLDVQKSRGFCSMLFCRLSGKKELDWEDVVDRMSTSLAHLQMRMTTMGMETPSVETSPTAHV